MTTTVKIDAHAGWPVKVTRFDKGQDGQWTPSSEQTVEPNTEAMVYVHSTMKIEVEELRREE